MHPLCKNSQSLSIERYLSCLCHCVQGFCCFNLLQDAAKCPLCSEKIEAITCAFVGCAWMFDGRKLGPEGATVCCSSEWQVSLTAVIVASLKAACGTTGLASPGCSLRHAGYSGCKC